MPRGRPPAPPDEEILSSADILSSAPLAVGQRGVAPADPLAGMVVADRYRIVEPIGRGGMGSVYKVQHVRIGKLLAMKVLHGEMSQRPEVARRFKREALAVSKLGSPNTVQVFDFGVSEGLTYLVMELVSGETLARALSTQGPMPVMRLMRIVVQVCNALAEAHHEGIVHRDIKPENVMLVPAANGADVVKVLDFGLAKLREVDGADDETCRGVIMGTPGYMAPEQILGQEVDARTDVYGLGALMYRLATGRLPFSGETHLAVLGKHLTERPVPPAQRAPELGIPLGLSRMVMRALRKDPADRFQRIEDLQALLVEELRCAGSSSVESLLDPDRLRRIVRMDRGGEGGHAAALATRDEVDAYERRLRRKRYGAAGTAAALAVAAAGAALGLYHDAGPAGFEVEPNDTAAEATPLALGQPMTGRLGKRIDATHGDRDFYAFDLPPSGGPTSFLRLRVSALPSIATCALLYRAGFPDALGRYCAGRPGRELVVSALALPPGRYLLAILQDMDAYGGAPPYVHESISDTYTLVAESTTPEPATEIEPNDHPASATELALDQPCSASVGWARDEDVFCVPQAVPGRFRWSVRAGFLEGGVLEATPMDGERASAPLRVHPSSSGARSPWLSQPIEETGGPRCLRVRLAGDPGGVSEPYVVEATSAPDQ